jgi:hypothetical protein
MPLPEPQILHRAIDHISGGHRLEDGEAGHQKLFELAVPGGRLWSGTSLFNLFQG